MLEVKLLEVVSMPSAAKKGDCENTCSQTLSKNKLSLPWIAWPSQPSPAVYCNCLPKQRVGRTFVTAKRWQHLPYGDSDMGVKMPAAIYHIHLD